MRWKIQVPVGAPELAIGHHRQSNGLLASDGMRDAGIFNHLQLTGRDAALRMRLTRPCQLRRPQQASDMVRAKGKLLG
jgi:hypothetical protein